MSKLNCSQERVNEIVGGVGVGGKQYTKGTFAHRHLKIMLSSFCVLVKFPKMVFSKCYFSDSCSSFFFLDVLCDVPHNAAYNILKQDKNMIKFC